MSWKTVKIKFGDTLKRMKTYVYTNGESHLRMAGLRKKIHDVLKLPADSEFILTYIDEDGDVVTLFDDDDLKDALNQSMKFLMINVQLSNNNNNKSVNSYAQIQYPCPKIKTGVLSEFKKSVLQQHGEAIQLSLSKISEGEFSKGVAELFFLSLFISAQSYLMINQDSHTHSTMSKEDDSDD